MKNFEAENFRRQINKNKYFFDKLNREADNFIFNKSNPIINAIKDANFNLNNPDIDRKIDKLKENVVGKFFSNQDFSGMDIQGDIERRILKKSLEHLAENDLGGSLGLYENLEEKYLDILSDEAIFLIRHDFDFNNFYDSARYLKDLCNRLDEKNILDNNQKGHLFDRIKNSLEQKFKGAA